MLRAFRHHGIAFRYFDADNGGKPLVFQHGLTGDHRQILSSFRDTACRVVTLECRGHGSSELGPENELSHAAFADDLHALLTHIGVERAAFAGISLGAAIVANYATRHPESVTHLVMVRPSWFDRAYPVNMAGFGAVAEFLSRYGPEEGRERFARSALYQGILSESPDNAASLTAIFEKGDPGKTAALLRGFLTSEPGLDLAALSALPVPKQIHGTPGDVIHPVDLARRIADALPGAEYIELYPKSENREKHADELTAAIVRQISA